MPHLAELPPFPDSIFSIRRVCRQSAEHSIFVFNSELLQRFGHSSNGAVIIGPAGFSHERFVGALGLFLSPPTEPMPVALSLFSRIERMVSWQIGFQIEQSKVGQIPIRILGGGEDCGMLFHGCLNFGGDGSSE